MSLSLVRGKAGALSFAMCNFVQSSKVPLTLSHELPISQSWSFIAH